MNYFIPKGLFVLLGCFSTGLLSCENRKADPVIMHQAKVLDLNKDTVIVVPNEKLATTVRVSFVESLSDTALVKISTDRTFSTPGSQFLLPMKNSPLMYISELSGDSLFIKYQPYKKPISGNLTIEITFQK